MARGGTEAKEKDDGEVCNDDDDATDAEMEGSNDDAADEGEEEGSDKRREEGRARGLEAANSGKKKRTTDEPGGIGGSPGSPSSKRAKTPQGQGLGYQDQVSRPNLPPELSADIEMYSSLPYDDVMVVTCRHRNVLSLDI